MLGGRAARVAGYLRRFSTIFRRCFIKFLSIFVDFCWFLVILYDFCWFSSIFDDFRLQRTMSGYKMRPPPSVSDWSGRGDKGAWGNNMFCKNRGETREKKTNIFETTHKVYEQKQQVPPSAAPPWVVFAHMLCYLSNMCGCFSFSSLIFAENVIFQPPFVQSPFPGYRCKGIPECFRVGCHPPEPPPPNNPTEITETRCLFIDCHWIVIDFFCFSWLLHNTIAKYPRWKI